MNSFKVIASSSLLQMKQSISRSMFRFCVIVQPIMTAFIMFMVYKDRGYEDYVAYVMLGTAISSLWGTISYSSAGDIERERYMGALQVIFTAPARFRTIMLGKVLGNTVWGIVSMIISFVFVLLAFSVPLIIKHPVLFIIISLIGIISFIAVAMMLSAMLAISRSTRVLMNIMEYPILILCGIMFPIEIIPVYIRWISYLLSPTFVVKLLRMCVFGIEDWSLFYNLSLTLIVVTIVYIGISIIGYRMIDTKARINASLEVH
ncbi:ABC transporter permease [Oceanirhabdus sp. W0125-5]|uniref:ABC transporter permease n=1 Tax=Oceanirhabdus sp. W0125-5 TaxID=2999116 RepID=UPI0022F2C08A|nr:ABC transporter permease [Oceanirhabdus sp. W0125-5]WBW94895.1 ABC transporter permease [Oceanirhabdus sp. W0125-5]